jgi:L-alanine-DL-glutamate epimerase-like enolase superfamily enzyme
MPNRVSEAASASAELVVSRVQVFVFEDDSPPPVKSWFGAARQRTSLLVRVEDQHGHHGWGEIWSGHPALGAYHRASLLEQLVAPRVIGRDLSSIPALMTELEAGLLAVQRLAGEPGPVSHVLAGLDCAFWDMAARAQGVPLYHLLGGGQRRPLPVYASGVSPELSMAALQALRDQGFRAFKFKAGFKVPESLDTLARTVGRLEAGEKAMIDANCGWDFAGADAALRLIESLPLEWVEEPIGPERPAEDWIQLKHSTSHRLAAGENLLMLEDFRQSFGWLDVIQPDLGKWGGVSKVFPLAREVLAAGRLYCPHAFGSNIGAALAAHVLCAAGGDGYLELDANANPLRTLGSTPFPAPTDGHLLLSDKPGIGIDVDLDSLRSYMRRHAVIDQPPPTH